MQIQLEQKETYSIQGYSEKEIQIDTIIYHSSLIVSAEGVIADWPVRTLKELSEVCLNSLLQLDPEVILIGHNEASGPFPIAVSQFIGQHRIGVEIMKIDAACRTYNLLLNERRKVALALLF